MADAFLVQLLEWVAERPRSYAEAMEAWRSSCPRHPVWDDAMTDGLIAVASTSPMAEARVSLTARGSALLDQQT